MNNCSNQNYSSIRYQYLKEHKICIECGVKDAFYNHVRCPECLEKRVNAVHTDKAQIQRKQAAAKRTTKRKAEGVCVQCGEPLYKDSIRYCYKHLEWQRRYQRIYQQNKRARERTLTLDEIKAQQSERGKTNIHYALESEGHARHIEDIKASGIWATHYKPAKMPQS